MFCKHLNWGKRVHYQVELNRKGSPKNVVLIIDEADERMFRDLNDFYKRTKAAKVSVICLTATAFEGGNGGLEQSVLA